MDVLLWESEQTQKPYAHLITMIAQEGDLAWVDETQKEYQFSNGVWNEVMNNE